MAAKKAAQVRKTPLKSPTATMPGRNGGTLRVGNPGNKGGGRLPGWLETFCDDLLADPTAQEQVKAILRDKDHAAFASMWRTVAERAHGKPKQPVEHSGNQARPFVIRVERAG